MAWNKKNAETRIQQAMEQTSRPVIEDLQEMVQLDNIGTAQALRVHAAHGYVEILNAPDLLDSEDSGKETERSHKRLLRYLHIYQGIAGLVLEQAGARRVDFQNQRLHFLVGEPMDDEARRVAAAVSIADTLYRVIKACNTDHPELDDARIRVGIDSGLALAVENGTRGDREPLYLGSPANQAAKLLDGGAEGVYLSAAARESVDADWSVADPKATRLSAAQILTCVEIADLGLDVDALVDAWREEIKATPLKEFEFSRPTPPLSALALDVLTPGNSRRIECATIYADIDGFTRFVADRLSGRRGEEEVVQALHVIRKELRDVLHADFGGRKIRYNGDCLVGLLAEGPRETDKAQTLSVATLCVAAMRSSFLLIQEKLPVTASLGLAIGFDAGPVSITRLGPKGERFRCVVGRAVVQAEQLQQRCNGRQTGLAECGHGWAGKAVQALLPADRPTEGITYNEVYAALNARGDSAAPAVAVSAGVQIHQARAYGGRR